jgi:hypothetical protein
VIDEFSDFFNANVRYDGTLIDPSKTSNLTGVIPGKYSVFSDIQVKANGVIYRFRNVEIAIVEVFPYINNFIALDSGNSY